MIERLQRALEHIEELSPAAQEDLATFIEEQTLPSSVETPETETQQHHPSNKRLPKRIRTALAVIGSARELLDDDEFVVLDRIRHESIPTPPVELDDL